MSTAGKVAVRTLGWIGATAAAGAGLVALTNIIGPVIFVALSPMSGYGDAANPPLSMAAFDVVAPLLTGFFAAVLLLGACLLVRMPLLPTAGAMVVGFVVLVAWTTAVSGMEISLYAGALGVGVGSAGVVGIRQFLVRPAQAVASA